MPAGFRPLRPIASAVRWIRGHRIVSAGALVGVVAALVVAVVLVQPAAPRPVVYDNISGNFKVCLIAMADTASTNTVHDAVRAAQRQTPINAQTITVPDDTAARLAPYTNSLVAMRCQLIIAADQRLRGTVASSARQHPGQQFLYVGSAIELPNVHSTPVTNPATITGLVVQAARAPRR